MTTIEHSKPHKHLASCQHSGGLLRRTNLKTGAPELKVQPFYCGKSTCPVCNERRRRRLRARLHKVRWKPFVYFWTVTTDPKILDPRQALETLNRRWHAVARSIQRLAPGWTYFKVTEFTKSGLPHIHFITDAYIPWSELQRHLMRHNFGEVLHYKRLPALVALSYITKYVSKDLYSGSPYPDYTGRRWSASRDLLPSIEYCDPEGKWEVVWFSSDFELLEQLRQGLEYRESDCPSRPPPLEFSEPVSHKWRPKAGRTPRYFPNRF